MSAASLPASCSHRSYGSPRGAIAHITQTKAFSDSTPADAAERSRDKGRLHDFHRSFLHFLYTIRAAARAATEHARGDAHAQDRAVGEKARLSGHFARAPAGNDADPGVPAHALYRRP